MNILQLEAESYVEHGISLNLSNISLKQGTSMNGNPHTIHPLTYGNIQLHMLKNDRHGCRTNDFLICLKNGERRRCLNIVWERVPRRVTINRKGNIRKLCL